MKADNYNFVQLSKGYMNHFRGLISKHPLAAEILIFFMEKMGRTTNAVVCSYQLLQEVTGYSRPSVARAVRILKKDNWIDTVKVGNATAYCVNEKVAWQAGRDERQYAIFSATVVATSTEQESNFREKSKEKLTYIPFVEKE
ncbi:replication/maintenance protein RepL [Arsenophonus nasoniae]|uniref:Replication protein n=2 Tax=Arsenophonus TaxID=637 RepID=D2U1E1_9GAMM|nr:replication/maintenance protein RepL [Arsenophonus nasoniae]WGM08914.1 replication/maintenance protein RepL [Arsenophonus nasoniae]CBA74544.1 replication protein [Arsenophonus nasoniae]